MWGAGGGGDEGPERRGGGVGGTNLSEVDIYRLNT